MVDFDDLMDEEYDDAPHEGVMDLEVVGRKDRQEVRVPKSTIGGKLRYKRRMEERLEKVSGMFGNTGWLGNWSHKSQASQEMYTMEGTKPRWAVRACVALRDQGRCRVCGAQVKDDGVVGQILPQHGGGLFIEPNCMLLCRHCGVCWMKYKSFDAGEGLERMWCRLKEFILKRRTKCFRGCLGLDVEQLKMYKELRIDNEQKAREFKAKLVKQSRSIVKQTGMSTQELVDKVELRRLDHEDKVKKMAKRDERDKRERLEALKKKIEEPEPLIPALGKKADTFSPWVQQAEGEKVEKD